VRDNSTALASNRYSLHRQLAVFLLSFFALETGWNHIRGTWLERFVIDRVTVQTSVALINRLTPSTEARAQGSSIVSQRGSINVRNGCEGTEVLFLLVGGLLAYPFSWRWRAVGLMVAAAFVFALNQTRLLALFYSIQNDRTLFNALHGVVAPGSLVLLTLMFFVTLINLSSRSQALVEPSA